MLHPNNLFLSKIDKFILLLFLKLSERKELSFQKEAFQKENSAFPLPIVFICARKFVFSGNGCNLSLNWLQLPEVWLYLLN